MGRWGKAVSLVIFLTDFEYDIRCLKFFSVFFLEILFSLFMEPTTIK